MVFAAAAPVRDCEHAPQQLHERKDSPETTRGPYLCAVGYSVYRRTWVGAVYGRGRGHRSVQRPTENTDREDDDDGAITAVALLSTVFARKTCYYAAGSADVRRERTRVEPAAVLRASLRIRAPVNGVDGLRKRLRRPRHRVKTNCTEHIGPKTVRARAVNPCVIGVYRRQRAK